MTQNYIAYAAQHLFGAKRLVDGLLAEATIPYVVNPVTKNMLVRPIGLLMGLGIELLLKGAIALDGPVQHTHRLSKLFVEPGGQRLWGLFAQQAEIAALATQHDPELAEENKVNIEDAPALIWEFIDSIDALHSKEGNLYRYGGEGQRTPHPIFLIRVLWASCQALQNDPRATLACFETNCFNRYRKPI